MAWVYVVAACSTWAFHALFRRDLRRFFEIEPSAEVVQTEGIPLRVRFNVFEVSVLAASSLSCVLAGAGLASIFADRASELAPLVDHGIESVATVTGAFRDRGARYTRYSIAYEYETAGGRRSGVGTVGSRRLVDIYRQERKAPVLYSSRNFNVSKPLTRVTAARQLRGARFSRVASLVVGFVIGIALVVQLGLRMRNVRRQQRTGRLVIGEVVDVQTRSFLRNRALVMADGELDGGGIYWKYEPRGVQVGTKVRVLVDEANPKVASVFERPL